MPSKNRATPSTRHLPVRPVRRYRLNSSGAQRLVRGGRRE
jgi:hypothetical protein